MSADRPTREAAQAALEALTPVIQTNIEMQRDVFLPVAMLWEQNWETLRAFLAAPTEPEPVLEYGPNTAHVLALIAKFDARTQAQKDSLYEAYRADYEPFLAAHNAVVISGRAGRAGLRAARRDLYSRLYGWGMDRSAYSAALALLIRDLPEFTQAEYDALSHPWRTVMGKIHPDDDDLIGVSNAHG